MIKSLYLGNHVTFEIDTSFFAIGFVIGFGSFVIELGFCSIKFY